MGNKKWRGFAEFQTPENQNEAIMTVCPGNPDQEGSRFNAIMEAAGRQLTRLFIVQAGDLGFHNLKRFNPKSEAAIFARVRGERWEEIHQPIIDKHMAGRCEVIPMSEIVCDITFPDRVALIKGIYKRGNNSVTDWFNNSANYNNPARMRRMQEKGVVVQEWALQADSLDYLCDEYAMRSLMWKRFSLEEIYLGRAVNQHDFFQRENTESPEIDLTIPKVRPITIHTVQMKHEKRIGRALPVSGLDTVPDYARNVIEAGIGPAKKLG
jgi:hypothetical protein